MKSKKRLKILFVIPILFASIVLITSINIDHAYASSAFSENHGQIHGQVSAKPNASGGGCWESAVYPSGGLIDVRACISYQAFTSRVIMDSYVIFGFSQPYLWTSCTVNTYEYRNGYYIGSSQDGCLNEARSNSSGHYGPHVIDYPDYGDYFSIVCISGGFGGGTNGHCQQSPTQTV